MGGYYTVHRSIFDNFLWSDKPFSKGQAWIDLFGKANFKDNEIYIRGIPVLIKRGQTGRSELTLAEDWGWSRGKVRRFLSMLKVRGMIETKQDNKTTITTICNYEDFQSKSEYNSTPDGTPNETSSNTPNGHQTDTKQDTNNKGKKNNKEKESNKESFDSEIKEIVEYLNLICKTSYRTTGSKTRSVIKSRLSEKWTVEQFKIVIRKKYNQWAGTKDEQYLRPETLFGNKFEGYYNQPEISAQQNQQREPTSFERHQAKNSGKPPSQLYEEKIKREAEEQLKNSFDVELGDGDWERVN